MKLTRKHLKAIEECLTSKSLLLEERVFLQSLPHVYKTGEQLRHDDAADLSKYIRYYSGAQRVEDDAWAQGWTKEKEEEFFTVLQGAMYRVDSSRLIKEARKILNFKEAGWIPRRRLYLKWLNNRVVKRMLTDIKNPQKYPNGMLVLYRCKPWKHPELTLLCIIEGVEKSALASTTLLYSLRVLGVTTKTKEVTSVIYAKYKDRVLSVDMRDGKSKPFNRSRHAKKFYDLKIV